jgi:agmatine deiminase
MSDVRGFGTMRRWPAEWEHHAATWLAWPHHEPDWPGKFEPIPWVYAEIVRVLHRHERVEILCQNKSARDEAKRQLRSHGVTKNVRLHIVPTDRVWVRDSSPTWVDNGGRAELVNWRFNAWAKYDNYRKDAQVGEAVRKVTKVRRVEPIRPRSATERVVLEGGAIETNGAGTMLTTEECLLSKIQERNPGMTREEYEAVFHEWLGIRHTIWLGEGCVGDDTHGHVDDIARFVAPDIVVLAYEEDPADDNHGRSVDNMRRLQLAGGERVLRVVKLPYPRPVIMNGERLPASYANFYIANNVVIVPTFNDRNDRIALATLAELLPGREVVGIHAVDLVWGLGTLHCLTQQQPSFP